MSPATRSHFSRPRVVLHACLSAAALFAVAGLVARPASTSDVLPRSAAPAALVHDSVVVTPVIGASSVSPRPAAVKAPLRAPRGSAPTASASEHFTVAPQPITDSTGTVWQPSTGISGGTVTSTSGGIGSTGSPQLYQWTRLGVSSWSVPVPGPGSYAVDVLICDTTNAPIGARVFSVSATGGSTSTVLANHLDPTTMVHGWHPYHVTGLVSVASTTLTLTFTAVVGQPIVSGLAVISATAPTHVTLDQSFSGSAGTAPDSSVWSYDTGSGWEGSMGLETYTDTRANSALDGQGDLAITARATGANTYSSARLLTKGKFSFGYGTISARIQMPAGTGMWPAFWAMGTNDSTVQWPTCGEIDIVEALGTAPDLVTGHIHSLGNSSDPVGYLNQHISSLGTDWTSPADTTSGFHTYTAYYRPGSVTFTFDGQPYFAATPEDMLAGESWPFTGAPEYLLLDLAVGNSDWTGYTPTQPVGTSHTMLIDQVTVTQ